MQSEQSQGIEANQAPADRDFVGRQPLLALSGIGAAYGSIRAAMRRMKRLSPFKWPRLPTYSRIIPKYLRSNYVKYPALFIILLASTRHLRTVLNR